MLFGKGPSDIRMTCPSCAHSDTFQNFANWEDGEERGLRGKTTAGHIVVACQECRNELAFDSLSGKVKELDSVL